MEKEWSADNSLGWSLLALVSTSGWPSLYYAVFVIMLFTRDFLAISCHCIRVIDVRNNSPAKTGGEELRYPWLSFTYYIFYASYM